MKKTALALAAFSFAASAAHAGETSVTVYGVIDMSLAYTSTTGPGNHSRMSVDSGDQMASRLGFRGKEDLGGGLSAIFQFETGFDTDDGAMATPGTLFDRKSVVGLSGGWGTLTAGRQTDALEDIGTRYTSFQIFGGGGMRAAHFNGQDRITGGRTSNALRFDSVIYNGFTGSLFYGMGEVAGSQSAGRSMGIGGNYGNGAFAIGAAYYQSALVADTTSAHAGDTALKTFTIGASYQAGRAKLFGAWSRTRLPLQTTTVATGLASLSNANRANVFDIGIDYALDTRLHLLGSIIHDRLDLARAGTGATRGRTTQFNLGVDYLLSHRTDIYAVASRQQASDVSNPGIVGSAYSSSPDDASSQTVLRVGLRHRF